VPLNVASTPVITTISPATNPCAADVVIVATSDVRALLDTVAVTVETDVAYSPIKPKSNASPWFAFPVNTSGSVTARFEVSTVVPAPPNVIVPSMLTSPEIPTPPTTVTYQ